MRLGKRENHSEKTATIIPFNQNGDYFFRKGISAYQKQDLDKAIKYIQKAIEREQQEPVFHCQLAAIFTEMGDYERSNEMLHYVIQEIDDSMDECYFFMANNYAHLGLFDKAETAAKEYMQKRPSGEFYHDSNDLLELLDFERGEEEFEQEDELIIEHDHAVRLLEEEEYERAIVQLKQMIRHFPKYWGAFNLLAMAYFKVGKQQEALDICYQVLEEDQGNFIALCNLATFYHKIGCVEKTAILVSALEKIQPIDPDHRFKLASSLCAIGKYELAYEILVQMQKKYFRHSVDFFLCLAVAAFHSGKKEKAQECWKRASELGNEKAASLLKQEAVASLKAEDVFYD